jgi:ribonuclease D
MLRNDLYDTLISLGRLDEAYEAFAELPYIEPSNGQFDPDGYWHIGRPQGLKGKQMGILRELYLLREQLASQRDLPPFKVLSNDLLVDLARAAPGNKAALAEIKGIPASFVRRHGSAVLEAVHTGQQAKPPRPPRQTRPAEHSVMERYAALREWRRERAAQRGVESDVILSKNVLWILAQSAPRTLDEMQGIPGLGPWRLSNYGSELLAVLEKVR